MRVVRESTGRETLKGLDEGRAGLESVRCRTSPPRECFHTDLIRVPPAAFARAPHPLSGTQVSSFAHTQIIITLTPFSGISPLVAQPSTQHHLWHTPFLGPYSRITPMVIWKSSGRQRFLMSEVPLWWQFARGELAWKVTSGGTALHATSLDPRLRGFKMKRAV